MFHPEDVVYITGTAMPYRNGKFATLLKKVDEGLWIVEYSDDDGGRWVTSEYFMTLHCPFCPNQPVDSDHRACPSCREVF